MHPNPGIQHSVDTIIRRGSAFFQLFQFSILFHFISKKKEKRKKDSINLSDMYLIFTRIFQLACTNASFQWY